MVNRGNSSPARVAAMIAAARSIAWRARSALNDRVKCTASQVSELKQVTSAGLVLPR